MFASDNCLDDDIAAREKDVSGKAECCCWIQLLGGADNTTALRCNSCLPHLRSEG
jgi:hypothetical protein